MIRRTTTILLVALATLAGACLDMSAPKGPASISLLRLPSGYVVRGDVMRDSAGAAAKLGVLAFDGDGQPIADVTPEFFIIDSNPAAHFDASGTLVGDRLGSIRVIGQIGNLQTPLTSIPITLAPTTIVRGQGTDTIRAPLGADSASSIGSTPLSVIVRGLGDTTVQGVVVHYTITRTLESSSQQPAVYIGDASNKPASADTTDGSGNASKKRLVVLTRRLADQALVSGQKVDSAVVEASATYKGAPLANSPLRIVVPVRVTISIK
ncbi:MAG TPA: hypothetical protein VLN49_09755 [Gemmatimonadaceae bacterium]|nr:hypothetical protein [Gemmatimonadaceae bacterium]